MLEYYCYIFTFIITFNDFFQFNNLLLDKYFLSKKKNLLDEYFKKLIVTLHCLFIPPYVCNISRQFENLNNLIYI